MGNKDDYMLELRRLPALLTSRIKVKNPYDLKLVDVQI